MSCERPLPDKRRPTAFAALEATRRRLGSLRRVACVALSGLALLGARAFAAEAVLVTTVPLTSEERAYLAASPIVRLCVDPNWAPFERINEKGGHEGISADLLGLLSRRTGLTFQLVPSATWTDSVRLSQEGRCQALSFLNRTPNRDAWLDFTEPYFSDPNVFVTREEHPFIGDPAGLGRESIVFPHGTSMAELMRRRYPNLDVRTVESEEEAIAQVERREADLTMRPLIVAAYEIKKRGRFNLKIAGQLPDYNNHLRLGLTKGQPLLRAILDKGIATITHQERWEIVNRHVTINLQTGIDYWLLARVIALALVLLGAVLAWSLTVKRLNRALARKNEELAQALADVKQLQGIIPICMYCKQVRKDDQSWQKLESYVSERTTAVFSHGLCDACLAHHFPDEPAPRPDEPARREA